MQYHVLAFLDVLGFSEMVRSDARRSEAEYLPIFIEVIEGVKKVFAEGNGLDVKMFSDSVVVSAPLSPSNIAKLISACAFLQQQFLARGILLRGGLSYGKHYSNESVMYSDALVAAYEIESKQARYPRILVDANVFDLFINHPDLEPGAKGAVCKALRRDRDGHLFVHYLTKDVFVDLTPKVAGLLGAKITVENVLEKIRWLYDYHAYCAAVNELPEAVMDNYKSVFSEVT